MNLDSTLAVTKTCPKDGVHLSWGINRNTNDIQILVSGDILQEGGCIASKLLDDTLI